MTSPHFTSSGDRPQCESISDLRNALPLVDARFHAQCAILSRNRQTPFPNSACRAAIDWRLRGRTPLPSGNFFRGVRLNHSFRLHLIRDRA
jgi:hypothetical protein